MKKICSILHNGNPYEGFDADNWQIDIEGWNSTHPIFADLIHNTKPTCIIEVGTWKGASAIHMAQLVQQINIEAEVVCVDTFLGWPEAKLQMKNGFPMLYWQFLANVVKKGLTSTITPFPQTSELAAFWLQSVNVKSELVYIDGSHRFSTVYDDLVRYWSIVKVGGYLFGDDYSRDEVCRAVKLFARTNKLKLDTFEEKWVIHKIQEITPIDPHNYFESCWSDDNK